MEHRIARLKNFAASSNSRMLVFALVFAVLGTVFVLATNAAETTTQTFSGKLSKRSLSQEFTVQTETGQLDAQLSFSDMAAMTLEVKDKNGTSIAAKSGPSPVALSVPVSKDSYNLVVSTSGDLAPKGASFSVQATYPQPDTTNLPPDTGGDSQSPSTPGSFSGEGLSGSEIKLTWSASTDNVGVTSYDIYRESTKVGSTVETSFIDSGLSQSTTYKYSLKAKDAAGNESRSANTRAKTLAATSDTTPPAAPTNLAAKVISNTQIDLSWTASTDNVGVTGYDVFANGTLLASKVTATNYKHSGLTPGTNYSYYVKARDAAGNVSEVSNIAAATTTNTPPPDVDPPSYPKNLRSNGVGPYEVSLAWDASTDNVAVTGYDVYANGDIVVKDVVTTDYTHTGLTPETQYTYYVKAKDAAGNVSISSNSYVVSTPPPATNDTEPPTAPGNVVADIKSPTEVVLSWTASTDNIGVKEYKISRRPSPSFGVAIATVPASQTNYSDSTVMPNTEYDYYIKAYDAAGNTTSSIRKHVFTGGSANIAITSPASGETVTGGSVNVSGTASSLSGQITKVEIAGSYGEYQLANGTSNWSATIDTSKIPDSTTPALDDPQHPEPINRFIFAKVTDSTGDFKVVSLPIMLKNDTEPPTAALTSPVNNSSQPGFYTITGVAADNVGVKKVYLQGSSAGQVEAEGTTNWTANITTKASSMITQIVVFDVNGNKSTTPFNIYHKYTVYNGTISGKTYKDLNRNGVFDATDQVLPNHVIYLWTKDKSFGQQLGNAISDAEGNYSFTGLQDGDYRVAYSLSDWWTLQRDWYPTSPTVRIGTSMPDQMVSLREGSAKADFAWRPIVRNPDPNNPSGSLLPLASVVGLNGLTAIQYDDVVSAQEILDRTLAGKLIGEEARSTKVREGNYFGGGTAGMTNGTRVSDGLTGRCYDSSASSAVWWPYWFGYYESEDDKVLFHEYGHAWENYWGCVNQDTASTGYARIRGLDLSDPRINTNHEWSKNEIFAEDYRQLFSAKNIAERQENRYIPRANEVPGLRDYIVNTMRTAR